MRPREIADIHLFEGKFGSRLIYEEKIDFLLSSPFILPKLRALRCSCFSKVLNMGDV